MVATSVGTLKSMRANRSRNTNPELSLRRALWAAGLRGYRVNVKALPGKPDVVFRRAKLCIFVHGCFWHGCPECAKKRNLSPATNAEYWTKKVARNRERDDTNCELLESTGWRVETIWECELRANLHGVVARIGGQDKCP